jgi:hypothetical protein
MCAAAARAMPEVLLVRDGRMIKTVIWSRNDFFSLFSPREYIMCAYDKWTFFSREAA